MHCAPVVLFACIHGITGTQPTRRYAPAVLNARPAAPPTQHTSSLSLYTTRPSLRSGHAVHRLLSLSLFPASSMCTECVLVRRRAQHTRRYAPAVLCTTQWTNAVHTSHLPLSTMYSSLRSEYIAVAVSSHGSLFSPTTDCPCNITSVASLRMFCALTTAMPILQFHVPFIFPHPHFVRMCYSIPRLWEGVANMT